MALGPRLSRAIALALVLAALVPAAPARAIDQSQGLPGFCPTGVGVTVMVDFQALGGDTIVRCYPSAAPGTGLDALKGAGFQIEGTRKEGEGFVCRIENRPSAVEDLSLASRDHYREACVVTPPSEAYWSYWHAGNDCEWQYSQWGVKNRQFTPGGFEGWSFSLDATDGKAPQPRIAAVRPGTEGQPCTTPVEVGPSSNDPTERQPGLASTTTTTGAPSQPGAADSGAPAGSAPGGGSGTVPPGDAPSDVSPGGAPAGGSQGTAASGSSPTAAPATTVSAPAESTVSTAADGGGSAGTDAQTSTFDPSAATGPDGNSTAGPVAAPGAAGDPAGNVSYSDGRDAPDVRDLLEEQGRGTPWAPFLAVAVIVVLVAGAAAVAWRRRRLRGL